HETAAAQVAADRLGWPFELISVASGDTSLVPFSANTSASRSAVEMGNSVAITARSMRERLLALASQALEADAADLEVSPAGAWVRGVPGRVIPLATLIGAAGLEVAELYQPDGRRAHASGCHAAVVRLDLETGAVSLDRYVIAHDIGRVINPRLAEAQTHGAFAHGLGYALFEEATYDGDGNLAGTFLDYQIPGAPELAVPPETLELETPASSNPEGFRGAGEGGTIPVPAAMAAAIEDCARRMGVELSITDLPITPGRLFEARAGR
ncbi:MAG: xanthine dehydrogenase family protein molybdopterin-binding subunit, partial [Candidatus Dormibacteraceae bacterium]